MSGTGMDLGLEMDRLQNLVRAKDAGERSCASRQVAQAEAGNLLWIQTFCMLVISTLSSCYNDLV